MTLEEAVEIATNFFEMHRYFWQEQNVAFIPEHSIKKHYGYVLYICAKESIETGEQGANLIGGGATLVMNDGTIELFGSAMPTEVYLQEFEKHRGL